MINCHICDQSELMRNEKLLSHWNSKVSEYDEYLSKLPDDLKDWELESLTKLIRMSLDYDQLSYPPSGVSMCTRVVKSRRPILTWILNEEDIDYVILDGLYVPVEGLMIHPYIVDEMTKSGKGSRIYYDTEGMPEDYEYGTIKILSNGYGFVLKKGFFTNYIRTSSHWSYFDLSVDSVNSIISK